MICIFTSPQYSLCNEPLIELSNPGASGSVFYLTKDDEFIIKTVMHKEAEFLQKLLPGYYMVRLCVCVFVCVKKKKTPMSEQNIKVRWKLNGKSNKLPLHFSCFGPVSLNGLFQVQQFPSFSLHGRPHTCRVMHGE